MSACLPHAHGGPVITATLRYEPRDFRVDEVLGFEPSGSGEHVYLRIEKTSANTEWVAQRLAEAVGIASIAVGYAGLKDRNAVTRQTFSVQLPGRADPDWSALAIPGVVILGATRHDRKLKRGAHRGNRFRIRLRDVRGDSERFAARIARIRAVGVPNYFGAQRFGLDGRNLALAAALFGGRRMSRAQRGFALSAARAEVFNRVLAQRVAGSTWNRALEGEVWMLDGTRAIFGPEPWSDDLARRVEALDIHPTGPLWGRGELRSGAATADLERMSAAACAGLAEGLEQAGLEHARRALRLAVRELALAREPDGDLVLEFALCAGAFATVVLRELCESDAVAAETG